MGCIGNDGKALIVFIQSNSFDSKSSIHRFSYFYFMIHRLKCTKILLDHLPSQLSQLIISRGLDMHDPLFISSSCSVFQRLTPWCNSSMKDRVGEMVGIWSPFLL